MAAPWRIVGVHSSISIFDVGSNDDLQDLLSGLPLFPYMVSQVRPLATRPSDIHPEPARGASSHPRDSAPATGSGGSR